MSDEEIKKCLECCISLSCEGCPLKDEHGCLTISDENALALINRQQAEIEQLQRNLKQCENGYSQQMHLARCKIEELKNLCTSEDKLIKELRAELAKSAKNNKAIMRTIADVRENAIKEFAERLKKNEGRRGVPIGTIDNLLAEMVGGE